MADLIKTKKFILDRFKEESGGFGATPLLPATLEDTYFGTKALFFVDTILLKEISPKIFTFVSKFFNENLTDPLSLYRIIRVYEFLEKPFPQDAKKIFTNIIQYFKKLKSHFKRLFAFWYLSNELKVKSLKKRILQSLSEGTFRTLEDLYYLGQIDREIWRKYENFIRESQNGDGGFGFYPKTTSYLENTYYAVKMLNGIESLKREIASKVLDFFKACENSDGGYSRKPGGISYLETTALALESLNIIARSG
ncbi:MAG: prenyltransferase/squalene oxidase repeat-containing protein [Caldimicrobium sp.]